MPTSATPPANNQLLAEQIYDLLMAEIEPELLLANIPRLDAAYASETPEEHEARMQRYAAAYRKFEVALKNFKADVSGRVKVAKRASLKEAEAAGRGEEVNSMQKLEEEMGEK